MKRLFLALSLLAAPLPAQVSYEFANFQQVGNHFTTTLLFKNINAYNDPTIVFVSPSVDVFAGGKVLPFCASLNVHCDLYIGPKFTSFEGNVQSGRFLAGGAIWNTNYAYSHDGCSVDANDCFTAHYRSPGTLGILGCQIPDRTSVQLYIIRTCAADGYTGAFGIGLQFTWSFITPVVVPQFDVSDMSASFTNVTVAGPAVFILPEPETWALMAAGLLAVGFARRKRA